MTVSEIQSYPFPLPKELNYTICSLLDPRSLFIVYQVNQKGKKIIFDILWKEQKPLVSNTKTLLNHLIEFLNETHFPLRGATYPGVNQSLQDLLLQLNHPSKKLFPIFRFQPFLIVRMRKIFKPLPQVFFQIAAHSIVQSQATQYFNEEECIQLKKINLCASEILFQEPEILSLSKEGGFIKKMREKLEEKLDPQLWGLIASDQKNPLFFKKYCEMHWNDPISTSWHLFRAHFQLLDKYKKQLKTPQKENTAPLLEELIKLRWFKEAWQLRKQPSDFSAELKEIWNEQIPKIIRSMIIQGDFENVIQLIKQQEPDLIFPLFEEIGMTYIQLGQNIYAESIISLLSQMDEKEAKATQISLIETMGHYYAKERRFDKTIDCCKRLEEARREQFSLLNRLPHTHLFQSYPRDQLREQLTQELQILRQNSPEDTDFFSEVFEDNAFISLLCKTGEIEKARELLHQGLPILQALYLDEERFFDFLFEHNFFFLLCKLGSIDFAMRLMETMPLDYSPLKSCEILYRKNLYKIFQEITHLIILQLSTPDPFPSELIDKALLISSKFLKKRQKQQALQFLLQALQKTTESTHPMHQKPLKQALKQIEALT